MGSHNIPIMLKGPNLGKRHRYFNSLVTEAYNIAVPIQTILISPELTAVDRLFKIDLASKHRHVEYIIRNLQDDDMLFVSRALKSTWLFEEQYCHIMNPDHLETVLYPHMITTAVNKMKHWIVINLNDSLRCQEFYKYYSKKHSNYAFKFLCKCPDEIILSEFPVSVMLDKISPQRLKVLCEKTPAVAKLFYEMLTKDEILLKKYLGNEHKYYDKLKFILKVNSEIFLDITEQHFLPHFKRLSTVLTKKIMTHQKDRFMLKPELYITQILNVSAVAQCLTPDECENIVIKLACAHYLYDGHWFDYKNVEPLVKRLDFVKRANFKKKVFVDKDVGEPVLEWPYAVPKKLRYNDISDVFLEQKESNIYDNFGDSLFCDRYLKLERLGCCYSGPVAKKKTLLDALFEEYRFFTFDKTLFELRKKLRSESSSQNRMYMFLILVSKTGGRPESLEALLHLMMEYKNEPCQVRAAVIRSLVKRVSVWRIDENIWKNILVFGHGLGLDGNVAEADCTEGIHAVVIRALLSHNDCEPAIKTAFLKNFSTFSDYSLTKVETDHIKEALLKLLIERANAEADAKSGAQILEYAIDTLEAYKIKFDTRHDVINSIKTVLRKDPPVVKYLLERLFRSKLGRKELYRENFEFVQTDQSYLNALKHDITILSVDTFIKAVVYDKLCAEQFLMKMSIYFNGKDDLASRFLITLKETKKHKNLARPIAFLIGDNLKSYILDLDSNLEKHKQFSARIRANAHVARPAFNVNLLKWQNVGAKLIANQVIKCKAVNVDEMIKKLLTWKKTARLAIILAQRTNYAADIFASVVKIRPILVLKTALTYFRQQGNQSDLRIWKIVKPLIAKTNPNVHLVQNMTENVDSIPSTILPEYLTETFKLISEIDFNKSLGLLFRIKINLSKVDEIFVENILKMFIQNRFILDKAPTRGFNFEYDKIAELYLNIFGKYLLLCKSEESQKDRLKNVGQMYLDRLREFWENKNNKKRFFKYLSVISQSIRYTEVFLCNEYVSCLPVMNTFVEWMQGVIPVEKYFAVYVPFYLNMLYYKTICYAVIEMPGVLDDKEKRDKGYKIVGETFGRYVGQEARVLSKNYFDSIVMLYQIGLIKFFNSLNKERFRVAPHFIKGVIDVSEGIECTIALDIYKNIYNDEFYEQEKVNILNCFRQKNLLEMQFFYENWPRKASYYYWDP